MKILEVKNLSYKVDEKSNFLSAGRDKLILDDINFSVSENDILGIAGESGSGKTTLAKLLSGILKPADGKIELIGGTRKEIQILFQNSGEIINPLRKVKDILIDTIKLNLKKEEDINAALNKILKILNLKEELLERRGLELSGGEQQRVALARLLIVRPKILILDEPFAAQDFESQQNILKILKNIRSEFGITLIIISHDLKALRDIAGEIIIMRNGKIIESGSAEKVLNNPENSYIKFLLRAEHYDLETRDLKYFQGLQD